jgi:polygalacturonase
MTPDKSKHKNTTNKTSKLVIPAFYAKNAHDISITGLGAIDGSGAYWRPVKRSKVSSSEWKQYTQMGGIISEKGDIWYPYNLKNVPSLTDSPEEEANTRADLIRFEHCERVLFQDITVQNSPRFHVHPCYCKDVSVLGVTVRCPWNAQNGDAIDLSNCNRCLITECTIDAGDDGICLKSGSGKNGVLAGPCKDILVEDNTVIHAHGGFVIGSDASGGVQNVVVRNNRFMGTDTGLRFKTSYGRGGATANIYISNIVMTDIRDQAIVFEASYSNNQVGQEDKHVGATDFAPDFKDIHIEKVTCRGCKTGILAKGDEGLIHDIDIKNSVIFYIKQPTEIEKTCQLDVSNVTFKTFVLDMW